MLAAMVLVGQVSTVNLSNISRPKIDMVVGRVDRLQASADWFYASSNFAHMPLVNLSCSLPLPLCWWVGLRTVIPFGYAVVEPSCV